MKNLIRKELLGKGQQKTQRLITRAILTSQNSFYKHHLADTDNDIIVYSPLPSINYPDITIDEYVWSYVSKWTSKVAVVSVRDFHAQNLFAKKS